MTTLCSVQQCLTGTRDSKRMGTAMRTPRFGPGHTCQGGSDGANLSSCNALASTLNVCFTSFCKFGGIGRFLLYGCRRVEMMKRKQLLWVSAWNICCTMKEVETSFWSMLSEGISPGVCTVIQGPNV